MCVYSAIIMWNSFIDQSNTNLSFVRNTPTFQNVNMANTVPLPTPSEKYQCPWSTVLFITETSTSFGLRLFSVHSINSNMTSPTVSIVTIGKTLEGIHPSCSIRLKSVPIGRSRVFWWIMKRDVHWVMNARSLMVGKKWSIILSISSSIDVLNIIIIRHVIRNTVHSTILLIRHSSQNSTRLVSRLRLNLISIVSSMKHPITDCNRDKRYSTITD